MKIILLDEFSVMVDANEDKAAAAFVLGLCLQFLDLVSPLITVGEGRLRLCGVIAIPDGETGAVEVVGTSSAGVCSFKNISVSRSVQSTSAQDDVCEFMSISQSGTLGRLLLSSSSEDTAP